MANFCEKQASSWLKNGGEKIVLKVGRISTKNYILTVPEKQPARIGNKTKIILEITPYQREIEVWQLKASKMRMEKRVKKEK